MRNDTRRDRRAHGSKDAPADRPPGPRKVPAAGVIGAASIVLGSLLVNPLFVAAAVGVAGLTVRSKMTRGSHTSPSG